MKITITARHLELTKALHDYAEKKVRKVKKYFTNVIDAHIILTVTKNTQLAEVILHSPGITINANEEGGDMYAAIDLVVDNLERQVKRHKEKMKAKSRQHRASRRKIKQSDDLPEDMGEQGKVPISEVKRFDIKPMTPEEAVAQMKLMRHDQWVFVSSETGKVTFIYKKDNGEYGVIEPND
ncbi:MAG: ribosome-associated translation inhibitor RaiA [bacterium]